ncbi:PspC domain-containing protein [bacterium]|nr:PspC domain-containing protein [bacterium]
MEENINRTEMPRKLYKSRHDKMIDGVCGGVAEYFGMSSALVRVLFILFGFFGGTGIIAYITAMILVPANPGHKPAHNLSEQEAYDIQNKKNVNYSLFWGIILILLGGVLFLDLINMFEFRRFWRHFDWDFVVPIALIVVGLFLILSGSKLKTFENSLTEAGAQSDFRRNSHDKKIWGVCSGLANYTSIDVSIIRILWVVFTFMTFPIGILAYVLIAVLTPDESNNKIFGSKTVNP